MSRFARSVRRCALASVLGIVPLGASSPPSLHVSMTDRAIVVDDRGRIVSTATICPGFSFDNLGVGGPQFSPDLHWILVDVRGPFEPGNVPRNHVLIDARTGAIVLSSDFRHYFGVPSSLDAIAWASGDRATLRYKDGTVATLADPPLHALPKTHCGPG